MRIRVIDRKPLPTGYAAVACFMYEGESAPAGLDASPEIVTGACDNISHPGGFDLVHASGTDDLIEHSIGYRAD